mmetsp:Transcript_99118/g.171881  ORF Transcript_99118/g.171881 Transcript_99118/m.171881 type:complete len:621 (-) Transcript_99118:82-1944(-)
MSEVCSRLPREKSLPRASSRAPSEYQRHRAEVHDPVLAAKIRKEIRQERSKSVPRRESSLHRDRPPTYEIPRPAATYIPVSTRAAMAHAANGVYSRSLLLRMRPRVDPRRQGPWKAVPDVWSDVWETREPARPRRRSHSQHPSDRLSPSWQVPFLSSDDNSSTDGRRQDVSGKFVDSLPEDDRDCKCAAMRRSRSVGERSMEASARCEEDSWWRDRDCTFSKPDENVRAGSQSTSARSRLGAFSAYLGGSDAKKAEKAPLEFPQRPCAVRAPRAKPQKVLPAHLAAALRESVLKPSLKTQNLHQGMALWAWKLQQDMTQNPEASEGRAQRSGNPCAALSPKSACSSPSGSAVGERSPGVKSLRREALALLNKISPENELLIVSQLTGLQVKSEEDLLDMADVVVDKAIHDPCYVEVYTNVIAELCLAFPEDRVYDNQHFLDASFRACVLSVCQDAFHDLRRRMQLEEGGAHSCANLSEEEQEEAHHKLKDRALACCKLLAHLYLHGLVPRQLIEHTVINLFLPSPEEERNSNNLDAWFFFDELDDAPASLFPPALSLVCLCDVLRLVGLKWSRNQRGMTVISYWLLALQSLQANAKSYYPPRIRYLIQDLVDVACNAWVR